MSEFVYIKALLPRHTTNTPTATLLFGDTKGNEVSSSRLNRYIYMQKEIWNQMNFIGWVKLLFAVDLWPSPDGKTDENGGWMILHLFHTLLFLSFASPNGSVLAPTTNGPMAMVIYGPTCILDGCFPIVFLVKLPTFIMI